MPADGVGSSVIIALAALLWLAYLIPVWLRRLITIVPSFVVVWLGVNATQALVLSQVVLSIALPLPMIALLIFTRRSDLMGAFANGTLTQIAGLLGTAVVLLLNAFLVLQILGVDIPGLPGGG